jgi:hypothetical protein
MNKQIRAMITLDDDKSENHTEEDNAESETKPDETETQASLQSQLSMYAVQATSSAVSTVVLTVCTGKIKATALVDTDIQAALEHS